MEEIRKLRQRREEREQEREEMERLKTEEIRLRDAEQYDDWQQKEEAFHLEQTSVRSVLRLQKGREKPIDIIAKNLLLVDQLQRNEGLEQELQHIQVETRLPHVLIEQMSLEQVQEVGTSIGDYVALERNR